LSSGPLPRNIELKVEMMGCIALMENVLSLRHCLTGKLTARNNPVGAYNTVKVNEIQHTTGHARNPGHSWMATIKHLV